MRRIQVKSQEHTLLNRCGVSADVSGISLFAIGPKHGSDATSSVRAPLASRTPPHCHCSGSANAEGVTHLTTDQPFGSWTARFVSGLRQKIQDVTGLRLRTSGRDSDARLIAGPSSNAYGEWHSGPYGGV